MRLEAGGKEHVEQLQRPRSGLKKGDIVVQTDRGRCLRLAECVPPRGAGPQKRRHHTASFHELAATAADCSRLMSRARTHNVLRFWPVLSVHEVHLSFPATSTASPAASSPANSPAWP